MMDSFENYMNVVKLDLKAKIVRHHFQLEYSWLSNNALVGTFVAAITSSILAAAHFSTGGAREFGGFLGALIAAALCCAAFLIFVRHARNKIRRSAALAQEDRNRFALEVVNSRGLHTGGKFCLFLRPFIVDGKIKTETKFYSEEVFTQIENNTVENALTQAIDRQFPVIALGGAPLSSGPGGATVDGKDWVNVILDLMDAAQLIVVVPLAQPSTFWEIRQIHSRGYLGKTVFFVPPHASKDQLKAREGTVTLRQLYHSSVDKFKSEGIPMPRMGLQGGIYWLHSEQKGQVLWRYRAFKRSHHLSYKSVRKVILKDRNSPLSKIEQFSGDLDNLPHTSSSATK